MLGAKPPFKFMIVKSLVGTGAKTASEICAALRPQYGTERQCSVEAIERHLQTLKIVGLAAAEQIDLDENQDLVIRYAITRAGLDQIGKAAP